MVVRTLSSTTGLRARLPEGLRWTMASTQSGPE